MQLTILMLIWLSHVSNKLNKIIKREKDLFNNQSIVVYKVTCCDYEVLSKGTK